MREGADLYVDAGCRGADRDGGARLCFRHHHPFSPAHLDGAAYANANCYGDRHALCNPILSPHTDSGAVLDRYRDPFTRPHQHRNAHPHADSATAEPNPGGCVPAPSGKAVRVS